MSNADKMLITKEEFPAIFAAFEKISHDSGAQAGHTNYVIDMSWKSTIQEIERDLAKLLEEADSDFDILCIGDEEERIDVVRGHRITLADKLLQEFFEEL